MYKLKCSICVGKNYLIYFQTILPICLTIAPLCCIIIVNMEGEL